MVVDEQVRADRLFHALADRTRREIVTVVLTREQSVSELAGRFPISFAAVQKHVAVLERAGLVVKRKAGREQRVRGNQEALSDVRRLLDRLEELWRMRLDAITDVLADTADDVRPDSHHDEARGVDAPEPDQGGTP